MLSKRTGQPGPGFIAWEGDLAQAHEAVFKFSWHRYPVPFSRTFQARIERAAGGNGGGGASDPTDFEVSDQMVLVNGRRAFQSRFRQILLRVYDYQCVLCETNRNRLNPRNGLLLCRTHDGLFDSGIIRITAEGQVSWPGVTRMSLGPDLYAFVTARTATRLWKPEARYRPDPKFLRWRLDNPDAGSADGEI